MTSIITHERRGLTASSINASTTTIIIIIFMIMITTNGGGGCGRYIYILNGMIMSSIKNICHANI